MFCSSDLCTCGGGAVAGAWLSGVSARNPLCLFSEGAVQESVCLSARIGFYSADQQNEKNKQPQIARISVHVF